MDHSTLTRDQPEPRSWRMTIESLMASLRVVVVDVLGQESMGVAPPSRSDPIFGGFPVHLVNTRALTRHKP